ncbi:MAG: hypothetical protein ABIZ34_02440 [Candidatus Limnocylindrales bacterium]
MPSPRVQTIHRRIPHITAMVIAVSSLILVGASPVAAGVATPNQILRTAPSSLTLTDLAASGSKIAVAWTEDRSQGTVSFVRISPDGGQTFGARTRLGATLRTRESSLDVCKAGGSDPAWTLAAFAYQGAGDTWEVGAQDEAGAFFALGSGIVAPDVHDPDIACVGTIDAGTLAVSWLDQTTSPPHAFVHLESFGSCGAPCADPPIDSTYDLGAGKPYVGGPSVAASGREIHVTWLTGYRVELKRFTIAEDGMTVVEHATETAFTVDNSNGLVQIAANGQTVAIVYENRFDARVKVSENGGSSFAPYVVFVEGGVQGKARSYPRNPDVLGRRILVQGQSVFCSFGCGVQTFRSISNDGGHHWSTTTPNDPDGIELVAFFKTDTRGIAEAWDQNYVDVAHEKLRFHTVDLP